MKASWKGAVLAESTDTVVVEGNHYFPVESIDRAYFRASDTHTHCPWKGEASYYDIMVDGEINGRTSAPGGTVARGRRTSRPAPAQAARPSGSPCRSPEPELTLARASGRPHMPICRGCAARP